MAKGWRIFWGVAAALLVVCLTLTFLSYRLLSESLPQTSGEIGLSVLEQPVKVYRDAFGVPHIFALRKTDLYRAQGFVTAQDRLWQMDLVRRAASGTLSEVFGRATLKDDEFFRLIGVRRVAEAIVQQLSQESKEALQTYAEGVNAYISSHKGKLPVEFALLQYEPEPWTPVDSIALMRLLAWKLSVSWRVDLVLQELVNKVGLARAREVFPAIHEHEPYIVPASGNAFWTAVTPFLQSGRNALSVLGFGAGTPGSNAWVVSGMKTTRGKPLLANDPHLKITAPSVWHETHLNCGTLDVAGVTMPGIPGIIIGHNARIAWGVTNGMIDDVDFYLEKMHPDSADLYWSGQTWQKLYVTEEEITVRGDEPVSFQIRKTRNGPIISAFHPAIRDSQQVVSMRWTGQDVSDDLLAILRVNQAHDWETFTEALKQLHVPAQNYLFASVDGDIGYHLAGAVPVRRQANGVLPHPGWKDTGQWTGFLPFEKLPQLLNPGQGYIVAANNMMVDARYPFYLSNLWEPPSRATRIQMLLQNNDSLTIADFKSMQRDVTSEHARACLPTVLAVLKRHLEAAADDTLSDLYHLLKEWDGVEDKESVPASIFETFFVELAENTLADEMGASLYQNYLQFINMPFRVVSRLLTDEQNSVWFDDVGTAERETRDDIILRSLRDAAAFLIRNAGRRIMDWRWGEIHQLLIRHPLSQKKPLNWVLDVGPFALGGSVMTIQNTQYELDKPFEVSLAPSTRQLTDLGDLDSSLSVIVPGQSGQAMSTHYKDQVELWLNGGYHAMPFNCEKVQESCRERLLLRPVNSP